MASAMRIFTTIQIDSESRLRNSESISRLASRRTASAKLAFWTLSGTINGATSSAAAKSGKNRAVSKFMFVSHTVYSAKIAKKWRFY